MVPRALRSGRAEGRGGGNQTGRREQPHSIEGALALSLCSFWQVFLDPFRLGLQNWGSLQAENSRHSPLICERNHKPQ